jgi:hypothetical protein
VAQVCCSKFYCSTSFWLAVGGVVFCLYAWTDPNPLMLLDIGGHCGAILGPC